MGIEESPQRGSWAREIILGRIRWSCRVPSLGLEELIESLGKILESITLGGTRTI